MGPRKKTSWIGPFPYWTRRECRLFSSVFFWLSTDPSEVLPWKRKMTMRMKTSVQDRRQNILPESRPWTHFKPCVYPLVPASVWWLCFSSLIRCKSYLLFALLWLLLWHWLFYCYPCANISWGKKSWSSLHSQKKDCGCFDLFCVSVYANNVLVVFATANNCLLPTCILLLSKIRNCTSKLSYLIC